MRRPEPLCDICCSRACAVRARAPVSPPRRAPPAAAPRGRWAPPPRAPATRAQPQRAARPARGGAVLVGRLRLRGASGWSAPNVGLMQEGDRGTVRAPRGLKDTTLVSQRTELVVTRAQSAASLCARQAPPQGSSGPRRRDEAPASPRGVRRGAASDAHRELVMRAPSSCVGALPAVRADSTANLRSGSASPLGRRHARRVPQDSRPSRRSAPVSLYLLLQLQLRRARERRERAESRHENRRRRHRARTAQDTRRAAPEGRNALRTH